MPTLSTEGYPVQPTVAVQTAWSTPTTGWDGRGYAIITVSVISAPSIAYALQWSPDNSTWPASGVSNVTGYDLDGTRYTTVPTTIAIPEAVTVQGGGYFRLSGGTGGSFLIGGGQ